MVLTMLPTRCFVALCFVLVINGFLATYNTVQRVSPHSLTMNEEDQIWEEHFRKNHDVKYQIISVPSMTTITCLLIYVLAYLTTF